MNISSADVLQYSSQAGAPRTILDIVDRMEVVTMGISKLKKPKACEALWVCMFNDKEVTKNTFLVFCLYVPS